jgi:hypothetical protein
MLKKIKSLLEENRRLHKENTLKLQELDWANVFHDSIRGEQWINTTSLNIGRWAGSYAFFYVLIRILKDVQPKKILELGLGESTKVVSNFIQHVSPQTVHTIIEHDENWKETFLAKFQLSQNSKIHVCPLIEKNIRGNKNKVYANFETKAEGNFDFILVDGPFGSPRFSRTEVLSKVDELSPSSPFIILFDDTNRPGEQDTLELIFLKLKDKNIDFHNRAYFGAKDCTIICSKEYKFLTTL